MESIAFLKNHFPAWWNTKMSLKLLRHAAKFGLLYSLFERKEDINGEFNENAVRSHIDQFLRGEEGDFAFPVRKTILRKFSTTDVEDFIKRQANIFPHSRAILSFLALIATKISSSRLHEDWAFIDFPVLDENIFI
jgi:hypothetical protein